MLSRLIAIQIDKTLIKGSSVVPGKPEGYLAKKSRLVQRQDAAAPVVLAHSRNWLPPILPDFPASSHKG